MRNDSTQIGGGVVIFLLIAFLLLYVYSSDLEYSIQLQSNKILQGQDAILSYRIMNGLREEAKNVNFKFQIVGRTTEFTIPIGNLSISKTYENNIRLGASFLPAGTYVVATNLTYVQNNETKSKYLTLNLEIL